MCGQAVARTGRQLIACLRRARRSRRPGPAVRRPPRATAVKHWLFFQ